MGDIGFLGISYQLGDLVLSGDQIGLELAHRISGIVTASDILLDSNDLVVVTLIDVAQIQSLLGEAPHFRRAWIIDRLLSYVADEQVELLELRFNSRGCNWDTTHRSSPGSHR